MRRRRGLWLGGTRGGGGRERRAEGVMDARGGGRALSGGVGVVGRGRVVGRGCYAEGLERSSQWGR